MQSIHVCEGYACACELRCVPCHETHRLSYSEHMATNTLSLKKMNLRFLEEYHTFGKLGINKDYILLRNQKRFLSTSKYYLQYEMFHVCKCLVCGPICISVVIFRVKHPFWIFFWISCVIRKYWWKLSYYSLWKAVVCRWH